VPPGITPGRVGPLSGHRSDRPLVLAQGLIKYFSDEAKMSHLPSGDQGDD
jgi:hypothetical protein